MTFDSNGSADGFAEGLVFVDDGDVAGRRRHP